MKTKLQQDHLMRKFLSRDVQTPNASPNEIKCQKTLIVAMCYQNAWRWLQLCPRTIHIAYVLFMFIYKFLFMLYSKLSWCSLECFFIKLVLIFHMVFSWFFSCSFSSTFSYLFHNFYYVLLHDLLCGFHVLFHQFILVAFAWFFPYISSWSFSMFTFIQYFFNSILRGDSKRSDKFNTPYLATSFELSQWFYQTNKRSPLLDCIWCFLE